MLENECIVGRHTSIRTMIGRPNWKENLLKYLNKPYLARISQFLVLPLSQRQGFGQQLV